MGGLSEMGREALRFLGFIACGLVFGALLLVVAG